MLRQENWEKCFIEPWEVNELMDWTGVCVHPSINYDPASLFSHLKREKWSPLEALINHQPHTFLRSPSRTFNTPIIGHRSRVYDNARNKKRYQMGNRNLQHITSRGEELGVERKLISEKQINVFLFSLHGILLLWTLQAAKPLISQQSILCNALLQRGRKTKLRQ